MSTIKNRYDFSVLFDVTNGNPNGDPDADNMPRMNPETGIGLVSDVCIKRKLRNYMAMKKGNTPGYALYISGERSLNRADLDALIADGIVPADTPLTDLDKTLKQLKKSGDANKLAQTIREAACKMYVDVRTFGAVMVGYTAAGATQVRGPVQISFAQSVDPITCQQIGLIRQAFATEAEREEKSGIYMMGHKHIVPYGLYRVNGHISADLAEKYAGFSEEDKELLFEAILNMFENDHSAGRGEMTVRKLVIFKHDSKHGNTQAYKLFDRVQVTKKPGVSVASAYSDYDVTIDTTNMPSGVTIDIRE